MMDEKSKKLWAKYEDEFLSWLDRTINSLQKQLNALKKIKLKALENKCQVKGCRRMGTHIIITHEDGDHFICLKCLNKYFRGNPDESTKRN